MKRTLAIASSVAMVALAGCSSQIDRKTASGSYEYLKTKEQETLKVPSDLDAPAFSRDFTLPELGQKADPKLVGKSLMVRSPALVLPLVTGSHVEARDAGLPSKVVTDISSSRDSRRKTHACAGAKFGHFSHIKNTSAIKVSFSVVNKEVGSLLCLEGKLDIG